MSSKEKQNTTTTPEAVTETPPGEPMNMAVTLALCTIGWLAPGVSHLALGRWGRGILFTCSVLAMFVLGLAMQGRLYDLTPEQPLHVFAFLANIGVGIPYILAQRLGYGIGVLSSPSYDYGTTYLWVSGLLNYLIVLDAFDIAQGRKP
jgi:hypothetical protein